MYRRPLTAGGVAAFVCVRWGDVQEDLFARRRLAALGVFTAGEGI
jgi:hypothetical protein